MKISAMILATLAATVAVIPASAISDENFVGQVANLEDVATRASSSSHSLRGLATKCSKKQKCMLGTIWLCDSFAGWVNSKFTCSGGGKPPRR
jgi:hypothetical protein